MIFKSSEVIEVDTKKICLLCYDLCDTGDSGENLISKRASSLIGFKQILRYLQVNAKELFNCSPRILEWMDIKHEIDIQISICATCSLVTEEFSKVYKEYELIQFQLDKCLTSLHQSIKSGDDNPERVREFKKQMQPNKYFDMINASIAVNLRDETFKKCLIKLQNSLPRVTVQKINDYHTNATPTNLNDCHLNNNDTLSGVSAPVKNLNIINTESHDDIQDWSSLYTQSFEEEEDPLETDNDMDEEDTYDVPISIPSSTLNSSSSPLAGACMSDPLITNSNKRSRARAPSRNSTCDICNKTILGDINRHKFNIHPEYSIFKRNASVPKLSLAECKVLADNFFESAAAASKSARSGKRGFKCCYCDQSLSRMETYKAHLLSRHMELIVDVNRKPSQSTSSIIKTSSCKEKEKCDQCSKVFASKAQLNKHKETHSKMYSCKYCTYTSNAPGSTKYHELEKHIVDLVIPYLVPGSCPGKCFQGVNAYYEKLKKIGNQCLICGALMTKTDAMRQHMLGQHFSDIIAHLNGYLNQDQVSDRNEGDVEERSREVVIPVGVQTIGLGTDVKLEVVVNEDNYME